MSLTSPSPLVIIFTYKVGDVRCRILMSPLQILDKPVMMKDAILVSDVTKLLTRIVTASLLMCMAIGDSAVLKKS